MRIPVLNHRPNEASGSSAQLVAQLDAIASKSDFFASSPVQRASNGSELSRFVFGGPHGGGDSIPIGLFGGIHGDEQAGPHALVRVAEQLAREPMLAEGYDLYIYPICNPVGFDRRNRLSPSGKDLNREFWKGSKEPEVVLLEKEIQEKAFHGLISLHADDTSSGLYGFVRGAVLARSLLEPALVAAEKVLPRNTNSVIDGFAAANGIISECYEGILTSPPKLENTPFEIIFETPHEAPLDQQVEAFSRAILSILKEYRKFIAFAADL